MASTEGERSGRSKVVAVLLGLVLFLGIVPGLLYLASYGVEKYLLADRWRSVEIVIGWAAAVFGLGIVSWCLVTFLRVGKGTPNPMVPTRELMVTGPYKFCRNPIQLGAMIFYLGVGTCVRSLIIGGLMFGFSFVVGSLYHKLIEERELKRRFGERYEAYRAKTPFLIPRLWS